MIVLTQAVSGTAPSLVYTTVVQYVYADHLETARVITAGSDNKMRWRCAPAFDATMISKTAAKVFAYGFAAVLFLVGMGFFVAEVPVTRICRRDCWLNELLDMLFGDRIAKIMIGSLFVVLAAAFFKLAWGSSRKK